MEYATLKLSNFTVKLQDCDPIIALFDTGAMCSCITYQLFMKISDKVDIIRKGIGIVHLTINIEGHSFKHNFIICTKLKESLMIGLDFTKGIY